MKLDLENWGVRGVVPRQKLNIANLIEGWLQDDIRIWGSKSLINSLVSVVSNRVLYIVCCGLEVKWQTAQNG